MNKQRTAVDRMMDNINDLSDNQRKEIFNRLIDSSVNDAAEAKIKARTVSAMDFVDQAMERLNSWNEINGISSGYWTIDNMTMGFAPGELTIVAGPTSSGKSLLSMNIASNMLTDGKKVAFVTLEMTKVEATSRFLKILGDDMFAAVGDNLIYQQEDRMTWKTIPYLIENAKRQGADIVFIDHLHYFSREMHDVANELGIITQEFKQAAIKYNIPIVLISHTRKLEKGKKRATLDDLRGSSFIAQDADIVLMVNQREDFPDSILIALDKNRNRLKYRVGTEISHVKNGLIIEKLPMNSETINAMSINDVTAVRNGMPRV